MALPLRVLVADDSLLARMMLKKFVSKVRPESEIIEAKDGADALAKMNGKALDVALIDYNMPGMTGLDLARKLKTTYPAAVMALITANIQDYLIKEANSLGIAFISKPIEEEKIGDFFLTAGK